MLWCEAMFLVVVVEELGGGDAGWGWRGMQKDLTPLPTHVILALTHNGLVFTIFPT